MVGVVLLLACSGTVMILGGDGMALTAAEVVRLLLWLPRLADRAVVAVDAAGRTRQMPASAAAGPAPTPGLPR